MKFLNDSQFATMKANNDSYLKIVAHLRTNNPEMTEDPSADDIIAALSQDEDEATSTLRNENAALKSTNKDLADQVATLKAAIPEEPAEVKNDADGKAGKEELTAFAAKNSANPHAVLAKMKEEGFI